MRIRALAGLAALAAGLAILALPDERDDRRETRITVVPGGASPPGRAAAPLPPRAVQSGSGSPSAAAPVASAQAWGPPGVWSIPAEFAPPE